MDQITKIKGYLQGKKTFFIVGIGLIYLAGVWLGFWEWDEKILAAFGLGAVAFLRNALKGAGTTTTLIALIVTAELVLFLGTGCSTVDPGADALVVRVEQAQSEAGATFDLVLGLDDANRSFWKTNTPAFHSFCEWLRQPITYASAEYGPTNVPRVLMIQFQLDDLKQGYKASTVSSNALYTGLSVLTDVLSKAEAWETVIGTNR